MLSAITNQRRRAEVVTPLLNVLKLAKCLPRREVMIELFALIGPKNLTLEQLEMAGYLEIYINYLTQILIVNRDVDDQWGQKVREQIEKLLNDETLKSKLPIESFS